MGSTFIVKQPRTAAVRGYQDIEGAVVVDVGICCAARHLGTGEGVAQLGGHLLELTSAKVPEQMWRLGVGHALLHALDFVFDMSVGDEDVGPAIVVVVKE